MALNEGYKSHIWAEGTVIMLKTIKNNLLLAVGQIHILNGQDKVFFLFIFWGGFTSGDVRCNLCQI